MDYALVAELMKHPRLRVLQGKNEEAKFRAFILNDVLLGTTDVNVIIDRAYNYDTVAWDPSGKGWVSMKGDRFPSLAAWVDHLIATEQLWPF